MRNRSVRATTWAGLVRDLGISSVGMLKLDMEGGEAPVIDDVIGACAGRRGGASLCPRALMWETTHQAAHVQRRLHGALGRVGFVQSSPGPRRDRIYFRVTTTTTGVPDEKPVEVYPYRLL